MSIAIMYVIFNFHVLEHMLFLHHIKQVLIQLDYISAGEIMLLLF